MFDAWKAIVLIKIVIPEKHFPIVFLLRNIPCFVMWLHFFKLIAFGICDENVINT